MKNNAASKKAGAISTLNYTGVATAFLALAPHAHAQVAYVDVDPDHLVYHNTYDMDLDGDGIVDLSISQFNTSSGASSGSTFGSQFLVMGLPAGNAVLGSTINFLHPYRLDSGDAIAPGDPNFHFQAVCDLANDLHPFNWGGQAGFLGCRFIGNDGMDHYAWVQLSVLDQFHVKVMAYGYERMPDTGIIAGDMGATTGIVDVHARTFNMSVSPNPTTDRAVIALPNERTADMRVSLLTSTGQTLFTDKVGTADSYTLNLADQDPGVYFVRLQDGKRVAYSKVAKQ